MYSSLLFLSTTRTIHYTPQLLISFKISAIVFFKVRWWYYIMNMLKKVLSFFYLTDLYKLVLIFMIGSFIGYIVEMLYCYLKNGRFESRKGVIYGPFSPVYGFGAIVFTILLYKLEHFNAFIIFCSKCCCRGYIWIHLLLCTRKNYRNNFLAV